VKRDREPESTFHVPPAVMRAGCSLAVPFAFIWAIAGSILWQIVLSTYAASLPAWALRGEMALALLVVYAVFGVVFAMGVRVFLWLLLERRPRRAGPREPRPRDDIRVAQDWREL
jgi:hypothetical protein